MANPPSRTKRNPYVNLADQLYPEDGPQDESAEDEEGSASADTANQRTPMQRLADSLYPQQAESDDGEQSDTEETDQQGDDQGEGEEASDEDSDANEQQKSEEGKSPRNNAQKGKVTSKPISGSKSESYDTYVKTGGSRLWRNNNPGNIEYHGQEDAVGVEKAGRFAKFATPEAGMDALKNLLSTTYKDMSVTDAMKKYAPRNDNNDPDAYARFLKKHGVDLKKPVGQQVGAMAEAIKMQEGWIEGSVTAKK